MDNFEKVKEYITKGEYDNAEYLLDTFDERDAEWHYYLSVVYYKKQMYHECKKQLELAIKMNPEEKKYKEQLDLVNNFTSSSGNFNKSNFNNNQREYEQQSQMGGNGCMESCCQCIACNALLNCCCNCGRC